MTIYSGMSSKNFKVHYGDNHTITSRYDCVNECNFIFRQDVVNDNAANLPSSGKPFQSYGPAAALQFIYDTQSVFLKFPATELVLIFHPKELSSAAGYKPDHPPQY